MTTLTPPLYPRFLNYERLNLEQARAYAKKPVAATGTTPLFNDDPPASTIRNRREPPTEEPPNKRGRGGPEQSQHEEGDDRRTNPNESESGSRQGNNIFLLLCIPATEP